MKKKIILVRPYGYSGGTLVIDVLCKLLREHGVDARLFYVLSRYRKDSNPFWFWLEIIGEYIKYSLYMLFQFYFSKSTSKRAKRWRARYTVTMDGLKRQLFPFFSRNNTIVLYPEVVYGNYLFAKNVVRWLLYYNQFKDDPRAFGKDDMVICYRKQFNDWSLNPQGLTVYLAYFNNRLYRQYNFEERTGKCYILRKGRTRSDLPSSFDGPIIDMWTPEDEIVRIFNSCKFCYSYDTQTFYCAIAAVCGCIPIVVLEPGKTIKDYRTEDEIANTVGIAYGDSPEAIQHAIDTRDQLLQRLDFTKGNEVNVRKLIQYITIKFG